MSDQPQYRVLVIDDDPRLREVMTESLRIFGNYEVFSAVDGAQGLEYCLQFHPDVAVIDVRMPQLNGYQVVRALRGDPATAMMPVIILSALVQEHDRMAGLLSGADVYLTKPLNPRELVNAIRSAISLGPSQREARMQAFIDNEPISNGEAP